MIQSYRVRLVDVPVILHQKTSQSYLVSIEGTRGKAVWVSRAVSELVSGAKEGSSTVITLPKTIAVQKGLA
jgi:hypothetical protein